MFAVYRDVLDLGEHNSTNNFSNISFFDYQGASGIHGVVLISRVLRWNSKIASMPLKIWANLTQAFGMLWGCHRFCVLHILYFGHFCNQDQDQPTNLMKFGMQANIEKRKKQMKWKEIEWVWNDYGEFLLAKPKATKRVNFLLPQPVPKSLFQLQPIGYLAFSRFSAY